MMRKLLAALLAVLLAVMPAMTLAENYEIHTKYEFDSDVLAPVMAQMITLAAGMTGAGEEQVLNGMEVQQIADAVALLMNATSFDIYCQPDGVRVVCNMQEKYVCSAFVTWSEEEIALSTNLLPDLKLTLPLAEVKAALAELASVDWIGVGEDIVSRIVRWATSQRATVLEGSFAGDAYEGGVKCVQYRITDADIADLMESLLLCVEGNEPLMALLNSMFANGMEAVIRDFREYNLNVELESEYHYTFSMVYAESGALIGASLNVLESDELIATASLGANEEGDTCKLVVGVPLGGGVVYVDAIGTLKAENGVETLRTSFGVYQSDSLISYQQAAQEASVLIQRQTVSMTVQPVDGGRVNTIVSEYTGVLAQRMEIVQTITDAPFAFEEIRKVWMGEGDKPLAVMTTTAAARDTTIAFQDDLTEIDVTRLGSDRALEDAVEAALEKGVQTVAISLFQALPAELMTLFVQMQ